MKVGSSLLERLILGFSFHRTDPSHRRHPLKKKKKQDRGGVTREVVAFLGVGGGPSKVEGGRRKQGKEVRALWTDCEHHLGSSLFPSPSESNDKRGCSSIPRPRPARTPLLSEERRQRNPCSVHYIYKHGGQVYGWRCGPAKDEGHRERTQSISSAAIADADSHRTECPI